MKGRLPRPEKRSAEGDSLASAAGKARWGKADSRYEAAFKGYWYHNKTNASDADRYEEGDESDPSMNDDYDEDELEDE